MTSPRSRQRAASGLCRVPVAWSWAWKTLNSPWACSFPYKKKNGAFL